VTGAANLGCHGRQEPAAWELSRIRHDRRVRVSLERGRTWVFAAALDWPGWCRRGKGDEAALEALRSYAPRYAAVVGPDFVLSDLEVVGTVAGGATTDFGAPGARGPWDDQSLDEADAEVLTGRLVACWQAFDRIAAAAPPGLRKGPRGGGRDTGPMIDHVWDAERSYCRSVGVRVPPGTSWPEQRDALAAQLRTGVSGGSWPVRYAVRRIAWHVLDHAWEIEDKS